MFQLSGSTGGSPVSPYFVAGSFAVNSGAMTGGGQDFIGGLNNERDEINSTGSKVTTTADGNIQIVLTTRAAQVYAQTDTMVGVAGVETINGSMISARSGRIAEFDTAATSSGTIDLQTSTAAPSRGYAFGVRGVNSGKGSLATGGILNISGTSISTTNGAFDLETNGIPYTDQTISSGTVTTPDASGRVVFSITPNSASIPIFNLVGYIADATRIRLMETSDQLSATTGGTAYGQNASGLTVTANSYVFGLQGSDANGNLHAAGLLTLASSGNVTGTISYYDLSVIQPAGSIAAGTYLAEATLAV